MISVYFHFPWQLCFCHLEENGLSFVVTQTSIVITSVAIDRMFFFKKSLQNAESEN